jgi:hypothetical protein
LQKPSRNTLTSSSLLRSTGVKSKPLSITDSISSMRRAYSTLWPRTMSARSDQSSMDSQNMLFYISH